MEKKMTKEEICTHYGDDPSRYMGAVNPPIFMTSLFCDVPGNEEGKPGRYSYSRPNNPTVEIAEQKIAALENAEAAYCTSSGMAAISSAIFHYIKGGDHVVSVASVYGGARGVIDSYVKRFGVTMTYVNGTDIEEIEKAIQPNTTLIYLESPSSFLFLVPDIKKIAALAKKHGIHTIIDNTYSTPIFQNPLDYGIDLSVHSVSKYMGGHSDIVGGVICGSKKDIDAIKGSEGILLGGIMAPMEAYFLIRGLRTLPARMKQHMANAIEMAEYFHNLPCVKEVLYPFHPSHPQYELAKEQMRGCSSLMSVVFDLTDEQIKAIGKELQFFHKGCSWGGYESLFIALGMNMEEDSDTMKKGLVRIHIGLENVKELKADWDAAIKKVLG